MEYIMPCIYAFIARMIGAGFAGCAIAIVKKSKAETIKRNVLLGYEKAIGYPADIYLAETSDRTSKI